MSDFEEWYRGLHPRLASALLAFCGDPALAADATDEAFARALEHWPRLSRMASPEAWVHRTAINGVRRRARRDALERRLLRRSSLVATDPAPGWDKDLLDAIGELPDRQRMAVALHYIADLSVEDTASAMRVKRGTVLATIHAARAKLRQALTLPEEERSP